VPEKPQITVGAGGGSPSGVPAAPVAADRGAGDARSRSRWGVHLALIASFVLALVPLLLFGAGDRVTIHVVIACFFLALLIVHLGQRGRTIARLARQLAAWGSRARRRRLAISDSVLVFLVLNVLASGIWDFASGRNNRIPLPGLRHFMGWHPLSSVLLLLYLIAHVMRRRARLRRSLIR
jgi:hypothetical protein